jgi:hypothetical protein
MQAVMFNPWGQQETVIARTPLINGADQNTIIITGRVTSMYLRLIGGKCAVCPRYKIR